MTDICFSWEPEILTHKQKEPDCYFLNSGALLQPVAYITRCPKTWTSTILLPGVIVGRKYAPYDEMKELVERAVKLWFFMALHVEREEGFSLRTPARMWNKEKQEWV